MEVWKIAACTAGGFLLVTFIAVVVFRMCRKRKRKLNLEAQDDTDAWQANEHDVNFDDEELGPLSKRHADGLCEDTLKRSKVPRCTVVDKWSPPKPIEQENARNAVKAPAIVPKVLTSSNVTNRVSSDVNSSLKTCDVQINNSRSYTEVKSINDSNSKGSASVDDNNNKDKPQVTSQKRDSIPVTTRRKSTTDRLSCTRRSIKYRSQSFNVLDDIPEYSKPVKRVGSAPSFLAREKLKENERFKNLEIWRKQFVVPEPDYPNAGRIFRGDNQHKVSPEASDSGVESDAISRQEDIADEEINDSQFDSPLEPPVTYVGVFNFRDLKKEDSHMVIDVAGQKSYEDVIDDKPSAPQNKESTIAVSEGIKHFQAKGTFIPMPGQVAHTNSKRDEMIKVPLMPEAPKEVNESVTVSTSDKKIEAKSSITEISEPTSMPGFVVRSNSKKDQPIKTPLVVRVPNNTRNEIPRSTPEFGRIKLKTVPKVQDFSKPEERVENTSVRGSTGNTERRESFQKDLKNLPAKEINSRQGKTETAMVAHQELEKPKVSDEAQRRDNKFGTKSVAQDEKAKPTTTVAVKRSESTKQLTRRTSFTAESKRKTAQERAEFEEERKRTWKREQLEENLKSAVISSSNKNIMQASGLAYSSCMPELFSKIKQIGAQ